VLARDIVEPYPTVGLDSSAIEAARLLTEHHRPALVVVDAHDHPVAILPGSQVLRLVIPGYLQDDVKLAAVVDEQFVEQMCDALAGKTVAELLPRDHDAVPVVRPDDTVLEVAVLMVVERSPLVAVVDGPGKSAPMTGAVTLTAVLRAILPDRLGEIR